jgi:ABC-type Fe3+-hydroxamate transport system substrate-binding protein
VSPTSDDTGAVVDVPVEVRRVVSLVPSLTESVATTAPGMLVGATDWCTHPAELDVAPRRRAVVPIWRKPWMALGRDTFAGDVLSRLGVDNVLGDHDDRYPRIELEALPPYDLVVLPDEPYAFSPTDGPEAFPDVDVRCVSGRHLTWYGPSLTEAREVLTRQLA